MIESRWQLKIQLTAHSISKRIHTEDEKKLQPLCSRVHCYIIYLTRNKLQNNFWTDLNNYISSQCGNLDRSSQNRLQKYMIYDQPSCTKKLVIEYEEETSWQAFPSIILEIGISKLPDYSFYSLALPEWCSKLYQHGYQPPLCGTLGLLWPVNKSIMV